jgi:hypothetical protein
VTWTIFTSELLSGTLYLDPGSGSFLLQMLIAGAMGAALAVKIYWRKIVSLFKKDTSQPTVIDDDDTPSDGR